MKAKLIKTFYGYELLTQGFVKGSTNHELIDSLNIEEGNIRYKLSLKNCQAIERGYDLNELAKEYAKQEFYDWGGEIYEQTFLDTKYLAFKEGFQKALSILGDKKFSEDDMKLSYKADEDGWVSFQYFMEDFPIQTEWDVDIEMDTDCTGEFKYFLLYEGKPKLDADGCIILKRK